MAEDSCFQVIMGIKAVVMKLHILASNFLGRLAQALPDPVGTKLWALHTSTLPKVIQCSICLRRFASILPGTLEQYKQGQDCASMTYCNNGVWYLRGCYGSSRYDTDLYFFVGAIPDVYKNANPVCDWCVATLIGKRLLEQIPGTHL